VEHQLIKKIAKLTIKRKMEQRRNKEESQRKKRSRNRVKKNKLINLLLINLSLINQKSSSNRRDKSSQRSQLPKQMTCMNYPNAISELARLFGLRKIQIVKTYITRKLILEMVRSAQSPVASNNSYLLRI